MTLQKYLVDTWLAEPRTVIYVTHDIDEAIYLADRIAIMTPSPGRIGQYVTSTCLVRATGIQHGQLNYARN